MPEFDLMGVPKPTWTVAEMPDQTGRVFLITGGYVGIGEETVKVLLAKNARVYVAGRSQKKFTESFNRLKANKDQLRFLELDLGSVRKTKSAAAKFMSMESRLDVLINNAGVAQPADGSRSEDGYELQWGTNVLGHFVFTQGLLPLLEATISLSPNAGRPGSVRVVTVASAANQMLGPEGIEWAADKQRGTDTGKWYSGPNTKGRDYAQSKLGNILVTNGFARRYPHILSMSLHPGIIASDLYRNSGFTNRVGTKLMASVAQGALTTLYQALSPDLTLENNGWYGRPWGRMFPRAQHPRATDEKLIDEVWNWCERAAAKA